MTSIVNGRRCQRRRGWRAAWELIFGPDGREWYRSVDEIHNVFMMQALPGGPRTIYGDGQQTRRFCYVSDLIEGILRLSRSEERFPVNIGNPIAFAIRFKMAICWPMRTAPNITLRFHESFDGPGPMSGWVLT